MTRSVPPDAPAHSVTDGAATGGLRWRFRWEIWGALALALLVCGLVGWLHLAQERRLAQATKRQDDLRQARVDLAKGLLALSLARDENSPFRRDQGLALVDQSLDAFQHSTVMEQIGGADQFDKNLHAFRDGLGQMDTGRKPTPEMAEDLRIAFHDQPQRRGACRVRFRGGSAGKTQRDVLAQPRAACGIPRQAGAKRFRARL